MIGALVHGERHFRVGAIDRTRRGEHEVLHAVPPAAFQDVERSDQVALDVGMRIFDRIAYARLRRKVQALPSAVERRVLGFVDNVADLMRSSDLLVTKAGGLTLAEAFCSEVAVVVLQAVDGALVAVEAAGVVEPSKSGIRDRRVRRSYANAFTA